MSTPAPRPSRRRTRDDSGLVRSFLALGAAQQRTAAAALVVLISLGTPWYSTEVAFPATQGRPASVVEGTMSGISAFSFVEAAVLLVAGAVLALVWARATRRSFSLPAGDGTVVTGAAGWLGLLIVYRLFDRPEGGTEGATATLVGLSWGIFATLAAVGLLLATGLDQRRRDAELRAAAPDVPDGPVVDPADVVPVTGATTGDRPGAAARGAASAGDRPGAGPTAGGRAAGVDPADRPREDDRPAWDGPRGSGVPGTPDAPARPAWSGSAPSGGRPADGEARSRSWSFDDPDSPEPAPPRSEPSRRRPVPPDAPTRALDREAAAAGLRDAGVGSSGSGVGPADPTRVTGGPGSSDPTSATGGPGSHDADGTRDPRTSADAPTRVVSWDGAEDPTRALPAHGAATPDATDETRVHDVPPAGGERPRRGLRRRRDGS